MNSWGLHARRCAVLDYRDKRYFRDWDREICLGWDKESFLGWGTGSFREKDTVVFGGRQKPRRGKVLHLMEELRKGKVSHRRERDIPLHRTGEDTPHLRMAEACTLGIRSCSPHWGEKHPPVGGRERPCLVVADMEHSNPDKNR